MLLIEPVRDIQGSPSPSSSPTRGEERKEKDEILTPLDTEGERGRGGVLAKDAEGERARGGEGEKKKKGRVFRMTIKDTLPAVKTAPFEQGEELFDLFPH